MDWDKIRQDCGPLVWATVYRILKNRDKALDCCQEVFLEAIKRSRKAVVDDWPAFLRWLAVRRALDWLHRERRAAANLAADYDIAAFVRGPRASADAEFRELVDRVGLELTRLPERQAEAFWLCCVEEMSYAEAAHQMGTEVMVSSVRGMTEFRCLSSSSIARKFLGKTEAGIRLGATTDDVIKAYGKPEVKSQFRETDFGYPHKGWRFLFRDGNLATMTASEPLLDEIEVVDNGDGSWSERVKAK